MVRILSLNAGFVAVLAAAAQVPQAPAVGLLMSDGATVERGRQSAAPARAGELLFAGDRVRAGANTPAILVCPARAKLTLEPGSDVLLTPEGWERKSGPEPNGQPVASCYLPVSPRLSIASQQQYGVLVARTGTILSPQGTLQDRIMALPEPRRKQLRTDLDALEPLAADDPLRILGQGTLLEQAGLLFDAHQAYTAAARHFPSAIWLRRKIAVLEDQLLQASAARQAAVPTELP